MSELKKVDYSGLVGSQVLMNFSQQYQAYEQAGFLIGLDSDGFEAGGCSEPWYDNCRIYQNPDYWISNVNGNLVLPKGVMARSKTRDGRNYKAIMIGAEIGGLELKHIFGGGDIIAVQVTGAAEGYEL
jgi:hypothetical protein